MERRTKQSSGCAKRKVARVKDARHKENLRSIPKIATYFGRAAAGSAGITAAAAPPEAADAGLTEPTDPPGPGPGETPGAGGAVATAAQQGQGQDHDDAEFLDRDTTEVVGDDHHQNDPIEIEEEGSSDGSIMMMSLSQGEEEDDVW